MVFLSLFGNWIPNIQKIPITGQRAAQASDVGSSLITYRDSLGGQWISIFTVVKLNERGQNASGTSSHNKKNASIIMESILFQPLTCLLNTP